MDPANQFVVLNLRKCQKKREQNLLIVIVPLIIKVKNHLVKLVELAGGLCSLLLIAGDLGQSLHLQVLRRLQQGRQPVLPIPKQNYFRIKAVIQSNKL